MRYQPYFFNRLKPENVKIACESVIGFTGDKLLAEY
jgi:hypothetical protein